MKRILLILLIFTYVILNAKTVQVNHVDEGPGIDGIMDDIWMQADMVSDFVMHEPSELDTPSDSTEVYVLQDNDNLYFLLKCYTDNNQPVAILGAKEDYLRIMIDPFMSKSNAYYFTINASGQLATTDDGIIYDDGRSYDYSWDGVWWRTTKHYDGFYIAEVKIPFKSIRYKNGLSEWGVNFERYILNNSEVDLWVEIPMNENVMVSKYGTMRGVEPKTKGYNFELFPEGFYKYSYFTADSNNGNNTLSSGLTAKWDVTPEMSINATYKPDFSQIESDPYSLNLSRFPSYLNERRPFFLEGADVFRMSDFGGNMGTFTPLQIFYSRRIGKSVGLDAVPIMGGGKYTYKNDQIQIGALWAYTDAYLADDSTVLIPKAKFGAFRAKYSPSNCFDIGVMVSGMTYNRTNVFSMGDYNYAVGLDGVYRKGVHQILAQGAYSDYNGKTGYAFSTGYEAFTRTWATSIVMDMFSDSFDVSEIGYAPWSGRKQLFAISGPIRMFSSGPVRNVFVAGGVIVVQEPGDSNYSTMGGLLYNMNFTSRFGFSLNGFGGRYFEADTNYINKSIELSYWYNPPKFSLNGNANVSYSYNYYAGHLGYTSTLSSGINYSLMPSVALLFNAAGWLQFDTSNKLSSTTAVATPRVMLVMTKNTSLSLLDQMVFTVDGTDAGSAKFVDNKVGFLFSWNFSPKSWLYVALNDYSSYDDVSASMEHTGFVGAFKIKYLLYF